MRGQPGKPPCRPRSGRRQPRRPVRQRGRRRRAQRGPGRRAWPGNRGQLDRQLGQAEDRRPAFAGWPGQRPACHRVDALRYAGPDLAGPGYPASGARRGRERTRSFPRPVSGERGIQQPGQAAGVRLGRVVILRPGERRDDPQAADRDLAARAAPQAGRAEAQVREPGLVRDGQRVRGLGDHTGRPPGIERARREQVGQAGARRPPGDDERGLRTLIGIKDPGQPPDR